MPLTPDEQLLHLGITLPPQPPAGGIYKSFVQSGNLLYVSGHGPNQNDGTYIKGKVGSALNECEPKPAAR